MENYIATSKGFFGSFGDLVGNSLNSLGDALELISNAVELPIRLAGYLPSVLGASVLIVVSVMVVKFVVGR